MEKISAGIILLFVLMSALRPAIGYRHSDMTRLMNDLLNETRYNKKIRPIYNQDKVMEVNITPGIMTFEKLDVTSGELLTILYIQLTWVDEFLRWNPLDYGGITKLSLSYENIWIPSLSQSNGALKENTGQIINPGFAPVIVLLNGYVLLVTSGYFVTKCEIDTSLYPFDSHECIFLFFSGLYDVTEMELNSHISNFAFGLLQRNDAWRHIKSGYRKVNYTTANIQFSISSLQFMITLKRRPIFEIINVFLPILLLTVLNLAANFVPPNSGERLSFSITLYLSYIFITTSMVDEMPHVAVNIAFSSYIMLALNVLNTLSVLWSVLMVRMTTWKSDKTQFLMSIKKIKSMFRSKVEKNRRKIHPKSTTIVEDFDKVSTDERFENVIADDQKTETDSMECTWPDAAKVLEKIYFTVTTILVTCVISVMVCLWIFTE